MSCCGKGMAVVARPQPCADGRYPNATPDALVVAGRKGINLCGRVGSGPGGKILKSDVEGW